MAHQPPCGASLVEGQDLAQALATCPLAYKGLIADCDGVLIDSEPLHADTWVEYLNNHGIDFPAEEFNRFIGVTSPQMMRVLREENRVPETLDVRKMMDERRYYFYRRLETELIEIPGATTFLRTLSSRVPLALATSNLRETYDHILRIAGWNGLFSVLVGADDVTHPKPAPDIYQETVRRLNLPPEDCLVFEDSLPGLDAARTAGLEVVGVATSLPAETLLKHGARTTIRDFADREALLGALAKR